MMFLSESPATLETHHPRRFLWRSLVFALIIAVAASAVFAFPLVVSAVNLFALRRIEVMGNRRASSHEIIRALNVRYGEPLFALDFNAMAARVRKIVWVRDVDFYRSLSGTVFVRIAERQPVAALIRDSVYLIGDDGWLMPAPPVGNVINLPVITNYSSSLPPVGASIREPSLAEAVALLSAMLPYRLYERIAEIQFNDSGRYTIWLTDGGVEIRIGRRFQESIAAADNFLNRIASQNRLKGIKYIDTRAPGFIAVGRRNVAEKTAIVRS